MMRRQPTESGRASVVQEFRTLIGPEAGAEPGACRRITLMTPSSPQVAFCITPYTLRQGNEMSVLLTPRDLGLNRNYKAPLLPVDTAIHFEITAEQSIIAAAVTGMADLAVIIEFL
jgi:hypothetical protein